MTELALGTSAKCSIGEKSGLVFLAHFNHHRHIFKVFLLPRGRGKGNFTGKRTAEIRQFYPAPYRTSGSSHIGFRRREPSQHADRSPWCLPRPSRIEAIYRADAVRGLTGKRMSVIWTFAPAPTGTTRRLLATLPAEPGNAPRMAV